MSTGDLVGRLEASAKRISNSPRGQLLREAVEELKDAERRAESAENERDAALVRARDYAQVADGARKRMMRAEAEIEALREELRT